MNLNNIWQSDNLPPRAKPHREEGEKAWSCLSKKNSSVSRSPTLGKSFGPWRQWWGTPDTSEQSAFVPRRQSRGHVHLVGKGTHIHFLPQWTGDPGRGHWEMNSAIHNHECPAPGEDSLSLKAYKTTEETRGFGDHSELDSETKRICKSESHFFN